MKFILEINKLDNAAFGSEEDSYANRGSEIARILREVAEEVEQGGRKSVCMDMNGNSVGSYGYVGE